MKRQSERQTSERRLEILLIKLAKPRKRLRLLPSRL
jgi:hypothetical protein